MWSVVLSVVVGCAVFLPLAGATDESQQTKVTFNQSVEIPGQVLPAGTYWLVVTGDPFSRDLVRIYSDDRRTVYATILTVETQRPRPADGTVFTFAERESSKPEALLNWFHPGETIGRQFHDVSSLFSADVEYSSSYVCFGFDWEGHQVALSRNVKLSLP